MEIRKPMHPYFAKRQEMGIAINTSEIIKWQLADLTQPIRDSWPARFFKSDARHFQLFFLASFLVFGILNLGWEFQLVQFAVIFGVCLGAQSIGIALTTNDWRGLKSAAISSLSLCLMLKAGGLWTLAIAGLLTIGSKYLIRVKGKHVFNPTNFGIIIAILITGDAWISPGQWGANAVFLFTIGVASAIMLFRIGRIDVSLVFLGVFAGLQFCKIVLYQGWEFDVFLHSFTSGTLLLFTFFMITDPVTTPNAPKARYIWAGLVGVLAFILSSHYYVHSAPIWALFIMAPITAFLDRIYKHKKFNWR